MSEHLVSGRGEIFFGRDETSLTIGKLKDCTGVEVGSDVSDHPRTCLVVVDFQNKEGLKVLRKILDSIHMSLTVMELRLGA